MAPTGSGGYHLLQLPRSAEEEYPLQSVARPLPSSQNNNCELNSSIPAGSKVMKKGRRCSRKSFGYCGRIRVSSSKEGTTNGESHARNGARCAFGPLEISKEANPSGNEDKRFPLPDYPRKKLGNGRRRDNCFSFPRHTIMVVCILLAILVQNSDCKSLKLRHAGSETKNAGSRFLKYAHESLHSKGDAKATNLKYILDRDITEHLQKQSEKGTSGAEFHLPDDKGHVTRSEKLFSFVSTSEKEYFSEKWPGNSVLDGISASDANAETLYLQESTNPTPLAFKLDPETSFFSSQSNSDYDSVNRMKHYEPEFEDRELINDGNSEFRRHSTKPSFEKSSNSSEEEGRESSFLNKPSNVNSVETKQKFLHSNIPPETNCSKNVSKKPGVFKRLNTQETAYIAATQPSYVLESFKNFKFESKKRGQKSNKKQKQFKNSKERHRISKKTRLNKARRKRMEGGGQPFDNEEDQSLLLLQIQTPTSLRESSFKENEKLNFNIFNKEREANIKALRQSSQVIFKENNASDGASLKSSPDRHHYSATANNVQNFSSDSSGERNQSANKGEQQENKANNLFSNYSDMKEPSCRSDNISATISAAYSKPIAPQKREQKEKSLLVDTNDKRFSLETKTSEGKKGNGSYNETSATHQQSANEIEDRQPSKNPIDQSHLSENKLDDLTGFQSDQPRSRNPINEPSVDKNKDDIYSKPQNDRGRHIYSTPFTNRLELLNGLYHGLRVSVTDRVPAESCRDVIEGLKVRLTL